MSWIDQNHLLLPSLLDQWPQDRVSFPLVLATLQYKTVFPGYPCRGNRPKYNVLSLVHSTYAVFQVNFRRVSLMIFTGPTYSAQGQIKPLPKDRFKIWTARI